MRLRIERLSDVPPLLGSWEGRQRLGTEVGFRLWPIVAPFARTYRRVVLGATPVIVTIGSQGKSTTVRAIRAALGARAEAWVDRNAGAEVALDLFAGRPWHRGVALEVGIGDRGQMAGYAKHLEPSMVVVTSIGTEHHRSLGATEAIRAEKARMVESLPPSGTVFVNADDEHALWMASRSRAERVTFGLSAGADVRATDLETHWPDGIAFTLHAGGRTWPARTRFVGRDQVRAVLAAAAVALRVGEPLPSALARLERLSPTPRRLEPVRLPGGAVLVRDEYKSSLETIDAALSLLESLDDRRRFVVLGEVSEPPGSQGPIYRAIGARIAAFAELAVFVGGNFQRFAAGARRAGMAPERIVDAGRSWRAAVDAIRGRLRPGDVVLVKGRDTQRLDRVSLALLGREVRCPLAECDLLDCGPCPKLAG